MPDLNFNIRGAHVKPNAALPTLSFDLEINNEIEGEEVYAAALKCQVMIEAVRREYDENTQARLLELFGEPYRWEETLGTLLWTFVTVPVPRFTGRTVIEVLISCHEDQAMAAGKYFYAVQEGLIPLAFLFSGTLFYKGPNENIQVMQVSWEKEAEFKLPAETWNQMMNSYFPDCHWIRVNDEVFEKLHTYKSRNSFPTIEKCIEYVLDQATEKLQTQNERV